MSTPDGGSESPQQHDATPSVPPLPPTPDSQALPQPSYAASAGVPVTPPSTEPSYTPPPAGPAVGVPVAPQAPQAAAKKPLNVLGLVSLIVAGLGFIFACVPGALILGWVLLPIGFILGLVSLFLKDKGKALGIAAIIVSVVGTIVGVIVFTAVVATSFGDAFGDETVVIADPPGDESSEGAEGDEPAATEGTRENPLAIGTPVSTDDWTVVVNTYNTDGNAAVAEANQFNDAPEPGHHYEIVNYTVTFTGDESSYAAEVMVDLVTSAGNVIDSFDTFVVLSDSMGLDELFNGASVTGSQAFEVPDGETAQVRVQPGFFADEVFFTP